ncbi:hypothetical protein C7D72_05795, partial [Klebsiella pneumoniae]
YFPPRLWRRFGFRLHCHDLASSREMIMLQYLNPGSPGRINNPLRNIFRRASGVGSVFVYTAMI